MNSCGATLSQNVFDAVINVARSAGDKILEIYQTDIEVEHKGDGSPLTKADKAAHNEIMACLQRITPDIPVLSEESVDIDFDERKAWTTFWLVDPLDGTKEFINKNGEFTVNIALMQNNQPIWGVVHVPVTDITYAGGVKQKTQKYQSGVLSSELSVTQKGINCGQLDVVASRSHADGKLASLYELLESKGYKTDTLSVGSSLKFCMIAEGSADVYPRVGLTSEWDTAAAQAVLEGAGGKVLRFSDGQNLDYNKQDILNPFFLAASDISDELTNLLLGWYAQNIR